MIRGSLQERNGIYHVYYRLNGKQKSKSLGISVKGNHKREAERAKDEFLRSLEENPHMLDKVSFVDYIKAWLISVENTVDTKTYDSYKQYANGHIIPYFMDKNLMLQDITIKDIEKYYNYKSISGRLDGKQGGLSLRSIKLHGVVLNLIFKRASYEGIIKDNPCTYAKYPVSNITVKKTETSFYTVNQCEQLLNIVKGTPLYNMVFITFMYGLRRSEMLGLKWDAIDFGNETISIQHTVVLSDTVLKKDKTKNTSSKRKYPLLPEVKMLLDEMLDEQENNRKLFGNCYTESGYIFVKQDGKPYYPSYPSHELRKVLNRKNLPYIRWHDLRHSTASMLIEKGWHMKDISNWLGHADIGTTMNIYGHISMEHKRQLGNSLSGLISVC